MRRLERHPQVDIHVDEALAHTYREFGPKQVVIYERLIVQRLETIRRQPTIGRLREDLGPRIRVFCIARPKIKAPHGYIYRCQEPLRSGCKVGTLSSIPPGVDS